MITAIAWGIFQNAFVSFANPYLLKLLFDEATIKHNFDRFAIIAVGSFFIFIGWRISDYFYSVFVEKLKNNTTLILSIRALENYFTIPFTSVVKKERGYFITRIYDDIRNLSESIEVSLDFVNSFFLLAGAFVVLLLISYKLAIILLLIVIPLRYISSKYSKDIRDLSIKEREEEARMKNTLGEVVSSYKITKFFNIGESAEKSFKDSLKRFLEVSLNRFKVSMSVITMNRAVMSAAEIMVIIMGGYMMIKNLMTFGGFMGFMNAFWYVIEGFFSMIDILPQLKKF